MAHVYYGQAAGWINMPLSTEVDLRQGNIVLDGDPAPPPERRTTAPPSFRSMPIVSQRSPISATAEHLLNFKITVVRHLALQKLEILTALVSMNLDAEFRDHR